MRIILNILLCMSLSVFAFAEKLDEIVIFEESVAVAKEDVPANIEIIDSKKIEAIAPVTTVELLESIQGADIKKYDAKHVNIDLGGYGAEKGGLNNVIMLNGRKIISPDMSGIDWSFIPVDSISRIEVFKGGNSVAFGDRAMGGAINIVTKKPVKSGVTLKTEAGSFDTVHANVAGQFASEKLAVLFSLDRYETDGYRDNSELRANTGNADLTYYFDSGELNFYLNNSASKYGLPGSLSKDQMNQHGRDYTDTPDDGGVDYEYMYGAGGKFFLPKGELSVKADFRKRHRDYAYHKWGTSDTVDNLKSRAFNPYYKLKTESKDIANTFTVGMDYINYDVDAKTTTGFGVNKFDLEREMIGYYAFDRLNYKKAIFEAGFRTQKLKDDFKSEDEDNSESENAYNFLAGYDFNDAGKVYAKYDRSFRFPTTDELREYNGTLNTDIETQMAEQVSLGYSYKRNIYYFNTSIYSQKTDNEIFTNPDFVPFSNYNLDTKRKGADITFGASSKGMVAEISYSYVDAEIDEGDYEGKEIPLLSRNKVKALIGYKASCGFSVSYIGKYYGSTYAGNDVSNDKEKIDSYMISDLKVGYKIKNADIYLKVNNIFNEKYYDYAFKSAFSESYYPAPERNFMAGVSYKF